MFRESAKDLLGFIKLFSSVQLQTTFKIIQYPWLISHQLIYDHWKLLALHPDPIYLPEGKSLVVHRFSGILTDENMCTVILVKPLQAGGKIDRIADCGVVETNIGPHVADDCRPGIDPDSDVDRVHPFCTEPPVQLS